MQSFLTDRCGSIAVIFGVLALPLLVAGGMAVDYGNITRIKSELQDSLDLAVLAGAAYRNAQNSEREAEAQFFLDGNFVRPLTVTAAFSADGDPTRGLESTVRGTATVT